MKSVNISDIPDSPEGIKIELPDIGLGTMRTSATYAALFIQLEGRRSEQMAVLDSVMEALDISPEEIILHRQQPDCTEEDAYDLWSQKMKVLREEQVNARKKTNRR